MELILNTLRNHFTGGLTALVLAMTAAVMPVAAQDISEAHMAAAREAVTAIRATDPYDEILPRVSEGIRQQLIANNPDLETQISELVDSETIAMVARRGDLETEAASAYAKAFSEADLNAIAAFYKTEAGLALLTGPGARATQRSGWRERSSSIFVWWVMASHT